jgi:hypothetical protein
MSDSVDSTFIKEFSSTVIRLAQQEESLLWNTVRHDIKTNGEQYFFERLGSVEAAEITGRHSTSIYTPSDWTRRSCFWSQYGNGDYVDRADIENQLIDQKSALIQNFKSAMGRRIDQTIIAALWGVSWMGKAGTTSTIFPATSQMLHATYGATGMTMTKWRIALQAMRNQHVSFQTEKPTLLIGPVQLYTDLLGIVEVTSADYNVVRALVKAQAETFLGCNIIVHDNLPTLSTDVHYRYCFIYCQSGIGSSEKGEETNYEKDPGHNYSWYLNQKYQLTACRVEDAKVMLIECYEA